MVRGPFRQAAQAQNTAENPIVLVTITHPQLDEPLRLSTDPTLRLSDQPLKYGTRSRLIGGTALEHDLPSPAEFFFVLMTAVLPDDLEAGVTSTDIVFEHVDNGMVEQARGLKTPARVDFTVVLASTPDHVDFEWTDLSSVDVSYDEATITVSVSREAVMNMAWPYGRMTKSQFPGLHR